ncbi:hypothetical protein HGA91_05605 [candidate division WWE3 bacterium]|nr:hypothetical protein [candidate division WWE3 bacterium]
MADPQRHVSIEEVLQSLTQELQYRHPSGVQPRITWLREAAPLGSVAVYRRIVIERPPYDQPGFSGQVATYVSLHANKAFLQRTLSGGIVRSEILVCDIENIATFVSRVFEIIGQTLNTNIHMDVCDPIVEVSFSFDDLSV